MIVELEPAPLAGTRGPAARTRARGIEAAQRRLEARILRTVPGAEVRWRYRHVLDGLAVVVPTQAVARLERLPGVAAVYPSVRYHALLNRSPVVIGAPSLWGPGLVGSGGRGVKIGIIDDGVDHRHPFFDPAAFTMPPGFPKGDVRYTTAKVIVARAFPPANAGWRHASKPFDPVHSSHGTHVAGIAAGNAGATAAATATLPALAGLSGVAPLAFIGNYKALTVPTASGVGLNGNSPELVAAIEAAVADGMDVINLSLGEPEVPPARDVVAKALDNAAAAGVIPVVAAGNDFLDFGGGSIGSPGTASQAITVAAVAGDRSFGVRAAVTGPGEVPPGLVDFGGRLLAEGFSAGEQRLVDVGSLGADEHLCDVGDDPDQGRAPLPRGALAGGVALVRRGLCLILTKAGNVADAGGIGLVLADVAPGDPFDPDSPLPVPALSVSEATGDALAGFVATRPDRTILLRVSREPAEVDRTAGVVADFSSAGPTPYGLALKPDVSAPGVEILSAVSSRVAPPELLFDLNSGTSMATPHVAGAAALLRERHPGWTVAELKSALVTTGAPVWADAARTNEVASTRQGGGLVHLPEADTPLLFAAPPSLAFGLIDVSGGALEVVRSVALADAGGGGGTWSVSVVEQRPGGGAELRAPSSVEVPGALTVTAAAAADAREGERTGFVVLRRGDEARRLPFWFRVTRPALVAAERTGLRRTGTYRATTARRPALVERYRYPDAPAGVRSVLAGPERVFRFRLRRPVVNFGVAVLHEEKGVDVQPRIVAGVDENRLLGSTALPLVNNPYLPTFLARIPVAAVVLPAPGDYSVVFDSPSRRSAGRFSFRFWVDDVVPPRIALASRSGRRLLVRVSDDGAGVDPRAVFYSLDGGDLVSADYDPRTGTATIDLRGVAAGRHRLLIQASDRQESKNTENVPRILPNTRFLRTTVRVP